MFKDDLAGKIAARKSASVAERRRAMRVIDGFAAAATMILVGIAIAPAHAISAQAARACDALVAKAFPPRQKGNPASGSAIGNAKDQRDYFNRCLANGGKVDDDTSTKVK
ncbi:hypothetical protein [Bradyrhizobium sp. SK17]|uniref:hypothetical protein n=1 Tax=Bradyrhizobium sp. SK17 TaxID=2057741 RepID=UPI001FDF6946|nr:hypothetical protein [Bradyrhizobium sp. SK17]